LDEILLTLPCEARWRSVAHLVLAGLAARLDLTVENLEDWQLALAELLGRQHSDGRLELVFRASPEELETRFGPASSELVAELEREEDGVGLRRVLSTLTDRVEVDSNEGGQWIVLRKANVHSGGTR
jgi:anti-sigma regulatory factor (Ser/Thr protein kinase)